MPFVHACLFCGWSRGASAATIIDPRCEGCGCVLVSSRRRPAETPMPDLTAGPSIPPALAWLVKGAAVAAVMAAGTMVGYDAGGAWLAGVGFAATGLFAVPPLVPQDY
jgi:hypothetical protein